MENTLSEHITTSDKGAAYDAACKRLLANKIILAWILKCCLEEYKNCDVAEIAEKYIESMPQIAQEAVNPDEIAGSERIQGLQNEDSSIREGTITYDIRFLATVPGTDDTIRLIINIEAQNNFYPGYPIIKRGIYYCGRLISSQYGTEFTAPHYSKIKKVYSIWICTNPPQNRRNTMNRYSIKEENLIGEVKETVENYDLISAIMICLGNHEEEAEEGILKLLEVLLSSKRKTEEKKKILREEFSINMSTMLEREMVLMCNLSEGVREEGIRQGIQQGRREVLLESIGNLMEAMKLTCEQAMAALGIPEADRAWYAKELNKK